MKITRRITIDVELDVPEGQLAAVEEACAYAGECVINERLYIPEGSDGIQVLRALYRVDG